MLTKHLIVFAVCVTLYVEYSRAGKVLFILFQIKRIHLSLKDNLKMKQFFIFVPRLSDNFLFVLYFFPQNKKKC